MCRAGGVGALVVVGPLRPEGGVSVLPARRVRVVVAVPVVRARQVGVVVGVVVVVSLARWVGVVVAVVVGGR